MKIKSLILFTVILVLAFAGSAFAEGGNTISVSVFNFGFNPDPVTISVGDTVEWTNTEGFHNVVSQTGPDSFSSGAASGAMWVYSKTFTVAGTYTYICEVHPSMQGTITVEAPLPNVKINEVRIDQPSSDNDEYFELFGDPNASLDGLFYIVIGDGAGGSGTIESVTDLSGQTIPADGFFVAAEGTMTIGTPDLTTTLNFENSDNVTHLLVAGFTGSDGDDLDTDDDGVLDSTPWSSILDGFALIEEMNPPTGTEYEYATDLGLTVIGPDGSFVPGQVYRSPDGMGAWNIGSFDTADGTDTVGAPNITPTAISLSGFETTEADGNGSGVFAFNAVVALLIGSTIAIRRRD